MAESRSIKTEQDLTAEEAKRFELVKVYAAAKLKPAVDILGAFIEGVYDGNPDRLDHDLEVFEAGLQKEA